MMREEAVWASPIHQRDSYVHGGICALPTFGFPMDRNSFQRCPPQRKHRGQRGVGCGGGAQVVTHFGFLSQVFFVAPAASEVWPTRRTRTLPSTSHGMNASLELPRQASVFMEGG